MSHDLRDEATAAMLAAVPDAFLRYDPAQGTPEAYLRSWLISAAKATARLYGVEPEAVRRHAPKDVDGLDPAAPEPAADSLDSPAARAFVRSRCAPAEWAVLGGYFGIDGGPGDGTARHVPALSAALGLTPAAYEGILKATVKRLRADMREEE